MMMFLSAAPAAAAAARSGRVQCIGMHWRRETGGESYTKCDCSELRVSFTEISSRHSNTVPITRHR